MAKAHDKQQCVYCLGLTPVMTAGCVGEDLGLSPITIYNGGAGTECLRAGRIKRGSKVFFLRVRVDEHKRLEAEHGECSGACRSAKPGSKSDLRLVAGA